MSADPSNYPISLSYGQKIIAVEFTKTLSTEHGYTENQSSLGDPETYIKRLWPIESSVFAQFRAYDNKMTEMDELTNRLKNIGMLAFITIALGLSSVFYSVYQLVNSTQVFCSDTRIELERKYIKLENELKKLNDRLNNSNK